MSAVTGSTAVAPGFARVSLIVTAWVSLTMFVEGFELQMVGYAAPAMIDTMHVGKAEFSAVFGAGNFGFLLGAVLLSVLGDRLGRRRMILTGVFFFSVCTIAGAYGSTVTTLSVLRFMAGIGLGGAIPNAIALTAEYAPEGRRASRITFLYVTYVLGGAGAGLLASWLIPQFGWPAIFTAGGWGGLLCGVLLYFYIPESPSFLALRSPDAAAQPNKASIATKVPFVALFQDRRLAMTLLLWLSYVAALLANQFITSWLPTLIVGTGTSLAFAARMGSLYYVGGAVGNLIIGYLADRFGLKMVAVGFLIAAPVMALMGFGLSNPALLAAATLTIGVVMIGSLNGINAAGGVLYPTAMRSTGVGWMSGVGRIGSIAGPVLGGILISLNIPTSLLFLMLTAPVLLAALAMALVMRVAPRN